MNIKLIRLHAHVFGSLCWTDTVILPLRNRISGYNSDYVSIDASFSVKALNLKLVKFDKELFDELVKNVIAFAHQFSCLFFSHLTTFENFRLLKVRKNQDVHTFLASGDLN